MGWIGCVHCEKFRRDFVARTFAPVRPVFAPSFKQQRNDPKCTQTLQNTPKHKFKVQWDESGAFVVYNSATTSWHKLLHYVHQFNPFCTKFHAVMK